MPFEDVTAQHSSCQHVPQHGLNQDKHSDVAESENAASDCGTEYPDSELSVHEASPEVAPVVGNAGAQAAGQVNTNSSQSLGLLDFSSSMPNRGAGSSRTGLSIGDRDTARLLQQEVSLDNARSLLPGGALCLDTEFPDTEELNFLEDYIQQEPIDQPCFDRDNSPFTKADTVQRLIASRLQAPESPADSRLAPCETQYPDDVEEEELMQPASDIKPESNLTKNVGPPVRDLQRDDLEEGLPPATQYPDLDDEEITDPTSSQGQHAEVGRMPHTHARGVSQSPSDFDEELDDFLADQVEVAALHGGHASLWFSDQDNYRIYVYTYCLRA